MGNPTQSFVGLGYENQRQVVTLFRTNITFLTQQNQSMFMSFSWNSYEGERKKHYSSSRASPCCLLRDLKCCWNGAISIDLDKKQRFLRFIAVGVRRGDSTQWGQARSRCPLRLYVVDPANTRALLRCCLPGGRPAVDEEQADKNYGRHVFSFCFPCPRDRLLCRLYLDFRACDF